MPTVEESPLRKLLIIGDRVLIKPKKADHRTKSGLFLPPGVHEKEKVQTGYVMKVGPGYPIPLPGEGFDEPWKQQDERTRYIPLQVQAGDLAVFLQKGAVEIQYQDEKYLIVSQHSILMVERDEALFG